MKAGDEFFPLELHPIGDRIVCTPIVSGALLPFNVEVNIDSLAEDREEIPRYPTASKNKTLGTAIGEEVFVTI